MSSTAVRLQRDHIADVASRASLYAGHAAEYAQIGDDVGLNRSVKMLCTLAAHAAGQLPALAEAVDADRRLRDAARAAYPPKPCLTEFAKADRAARGVPDDPAGSVDTDPA